MNTAPIQTTPSHINNPVPNTSKTSEPITLKNAYNILTDNQNEIQVHREKTIEKKPRIPPIVAQMEKKHVIDLLVNNRITNYHIKLTSVGVNIFCYSADDFKKARNLLISNECQFFTHDLKEETTFRIVLSGLEEMDVNDLKNELAFNQINPVEIKLLIPKQRRYHHHANYILHFKRGCTSLQELQKVKALFNTIVRWSPFRRYNNQTTQCRRCQLPGHGTRNCNLAPKCRNCAESHLTENCKAMADSLEQMQDGTSLNQFAWKCANCQGTHAADDRSCPKLMDYQNLQRNLSQRNQHEQRKTTQRKTVPTMDEYPSLHRGHVSTTGPQLPSRRTFSEMFSNQNNFSFNQTRGINSGLRLGDNLTSSSLFSYDECMTLIQEMITGLSQCVSKSEQFYFISSCCVKYVYHGSN